MSESESLVVVLVTGSRNWSDRETIEHQLNSVAETEVLLVQGGCKGADTLAAAVAREKGWAVHTEPAEWHTDKNGAYTSKMNYAAGPIRNRKMIVDFRPHYAFAFVMPGSKGTLGCIKLLKSHQQEPESRLRHIQVVVSP